MNGNNNDLKSAKEFLKEGELTCVLKKGEIQLTSSERGVKPLLIWIDSGNCFDGFSAADKVVGKAAALLYAKMNVKGVYGRVMSKTAVDVFDRAGIYYEYDTLTETVISRAGDGICPMERTVTGIESPDEAVAAIKATLAQMKK